MSDIRKVIRASAGTGKTYRLTRRYVSLLAQGEEPDHILATTFTRKAAGEILERVFRLLSETASNPEAAQMLAKELQLPAFSSESALTLLRRVIAKQHRLRILTLDSLFASLGTAYSFELGFPFGWEILERDHEAPGEALRQALRNSSGAELTLLVEKVEDLGKKQFFSSILETIHWYYDIFARTSKHAWNWISLEGEASDNNLLEAERIFEHTVLPTTREGNPDVLFKKAFVELQESVREKDFATLFENSLLERAINGVTKYNKKDIPEDLFRGLKLVQAVLRREALKEAKGKTHAVAELLAHYDGSYRDMCNQLARLGFSDVKRLLAEATITKDLSDFYFRLDTEIRHLLLDEFQDTSFTEWTIVLPVVREILSKAAGEYSFFCVGDVKQAIYGWRGGVAEIFDSLEEQFQPLEVEQRNESYRCSPQVIAAVNQVFASISQNSALEALNEMALSWERRFSPHTSCSGAESGVCCLLSEPEPIGACARLVAEIRTLAPQLSIGVLVRRNETVREVLTALRACGIEASEEGGSPLTNSAAVCVILEFLRLMEHPGDTIARFTVKASGLCAAFGLDPELSDASLSSRAIHFRQSLVTRGLGQELFEIGERVREHVSPKDWARITLLKEIAYEHDSTKRIDSFLRDVSERKVGKTSQAQVRVMTGHGSKGLEFDVVVLPELDQRIIQNRPTLLTGSSSLLLPPERVAIGLSKAKVSVVEELGAMKYETDSGVLSGALSLLYVMMTRARTALIMLTDDSRKRAGAFGGILKAGLPEGDSTQAFPFTLSTEGKVLHAAGDWNWLRGTTDAPAKSHKAARPSLKFTVGGQRDRVLVHETPSSQKERSVKLSELTLSTRAKDWGELMHRCFQEVSWIEDGIPENLSDLLSQYCDEPTLINDVAQAFKRAIGESHLQAMLSRKRYSGETVQLFREQRFALRQGESILSGAMDRVVLVGNGTAWNRAEVFDFKTDSIKNPTDLARQTERHLGQMAVYKVAAARLAGVKEAQVKLRLVFTSTAEIVEI